LAEISNQNESILKTQTLENAARILRPCGLDKYTVEAEWRDWVADKKSPSNPDAAFIGFCKMKVASI
jgi:hypothetical protein